jgi:hypothetical protein
MYDKPLTKKGEYRALVGMNLLEGNYEFDWDYEKWDKFYLC